MTQLKVGDRIRVTEKKHPVHIGQVGTVMSTYTFEGKDPQAKVRIDNGPICVVDMDKVEVLNAEV